MSINSNSVVVIDVSIYFDVLSRINLSAGLRIKIWENEPHHYSNVNSVTNLNQLAKLFLQSEKVI